MNKRSNSFETTKDVYVLFPELDPSRARHYNRQQMLDIKSDIEFILSRKISSEEKKDLIDTLSKYVVKNILKKNIENYKRRYDVLNLNNLVFNED